MIGGADVFLGLSAAGVLTGEMVAKMAAKPLIFALANPNPEITPEDVAAVRSDAIMATGRSDYPNQVNNVLCFPYIFRGALDVGATTVNDEMKIACVRALADLARKEPSEVVARAFGEQAGGFGPTQIIPKPFDPRYDRYWSAYHQLMERRGVTEPTARNLVRSSPTLIAALAVKLGDADAMIAGAYGRFRTHFNHVRDVIGPREGVRNMAGLSLLVMPTRSLFIADTYVNDDPDAETLADITLLAADEILRFGIQPKVALLSHSSFGSSEHPSARKMAAAVKLLHQRAPTLEVDGEMHGDAALDLDIRGNVFPRSRLKGAANLVVCPSLDAANIAFNLLKTAADGLHVGPMLLGTALPAHVLTPSVTARGITNMTALAVVEAQRLAEARTEGRG